MSLAESLTAVDVFFYIFAILGSIFAFRVVTAKSPISGAFSLVLSFFCVASIYALMEAHFLAAIQILVYAGAVMVLFVFVIMLLDPEQRKTEFGGKGLPFQIGGAALTIALFALFVWGLRSGSVSQMKGAFSPERVQELGGNARVVSEIMFSDFILPFELTSVLLLVGIVGSVALAKRAASPRHQVKKG